MPPTICNQEKPGKVAGTQMVICIKKEGKKKKRSLENYAAVSVVCWLLLELENFMEEVHIPADRSSEFG